MIKNARGTNVTHSTRSHRSFCSNSWWQKALNVNVDTHITMLEAFCHQIVKNKSQYITVQNQIMQSINTQQTTRT